MARIPIINVAIYQGEDFSLPLQLVSNGVADDVTDYSLWSVDVADSPGGTRYGAGAVSVVDASSGLITVTIPSAVTALMTGSVASFDVWATSPTGARVPIATAGSCPVKSKVPSA